MAVLPHCSLGSKANEDVAFLKWCEYNGSHVMLRVFLSLTSGANFENAYVTDVLMDRAVMVDANLRNAVFERTVRFFLCC